MGKAQFKIELMPVAESEINALRVYEHRMIVNAMREQLSFEPETRTRHRKKLGAAAAGFAYRPPLWELRVGAYRVLYDVDRSVMEVNVRAVRHKPPGKTTEEVLR